MLLTIHAATGAFIGQQINNPILVFVLAFISHFVLDMIPHGDHDWFQNYKDDQRKNLKRITTIIVLDISTVVIIGGSLTLSGIFTPTRSMAIGVLGGALPDILVGFHEITKTHLKRFHRFHFLNHDLIKFVKPSFAQGFFFQLIILGILIFAL